MDTFRTLLSLIFIASITLGSTAFGMELDAEDYASLAQLNAAKDRLHQTAQEVKAREEEKKAHAQMNQQPSFSAADDDALIAQRDNDGIINESSLHNMTDAKLKRLEELNLAEAQKLRAPKRANVGSAAPLNNDELVAQLSKHNLESQEAIFREAAKRSKKSRTTTINGITESEQTTQSSQTDTSHDRRIQHLKPIPKSVKIGAFGIIAIPVVAGLIYGGYRLGKYIHAKIKEKKATTTFQVSANLAPELLLLQGQHAFRN